MDGPPKERGLAVTPHPPRERGWQQKTPKVSAPGRKVRRKSSREFAQRAKWSRGESVFSDSQGRPNACRASLSQPAPGPWYSTGRFEKSRDPPAGAGGHGGRCSPAHLLNRRRCRQWDVLKCHAKGLTISNPSGRWLGTSSVYSRVMPASRQAAKRVASQKEY